MLGDVKQIKKFVADTNRNIHTSIPGKIVSVDGKKNTCSVQPSGKYRKADGSYMDYPQIDDVPIALMQGKSQSISITYPIKEGDGCMLMFSEQQLDSWKDDQDPKTELRHDLTNAICIPGLCRDSNGEFEEACENDSAIIRAEDATIKAKKDQIEVKLKGAVVTIEEDNIKCDLNGTTLTIEDGKITIKGNLKVEGSISAVGRIHSATDVSTQSQTLNLHGHEALAAPPAPPVPVFPPFT